VSSFIGGAGAWQMGSISDSIGWIRTKSMRGQPVFLDIDDRLSDLGD
jgi:hypothetical protein